MAVHKVLVTHAGEANYKIAAIGAVVLLLGLLMIQVNGGFAVALFFGGLIAIAYGMKKRTVPCAQCRTQISPNAATCPQCHTSLR